MIPATNRAITTRMNDPAMTLVMKGSVLFARATPRSYSSSLSEIPSCCLRLPEIVFFGGGGGACSFFLPVPKMYRLEPVCLWGTAIGLFGTNATDECTRHAKSTSTRGNDLEFMVPVILKAEVGMMFDAVKNVKTQNLWHSTTIRNIFSLYWKHQN